MTEQELKPTILRPAGYAALVEQHQLDVIPHWHKSLVTTSGVRRIDTSGDVTVEVYPPSYWPGDGLGNHLEFALKYDGVNLAVLAALFERTDQQDILDYVRSRPTGKYARRSWFLYEFLTGKTLPLNDLKRGNYVDLLDPLECYTSAPRQVRRQRINDNLLGDRRFCPMIRWTETLRAFEDSDLTRLCLDVVSAYSPELLKRALGYLYHKETKSSFEIEHIRPSSTRTDRFVAQLQMAETEDFCTEERLTELQNRIVEPRFRDPSFRLTQNYVGETVAWQREKIHYVCPKPQDVNDLMEGLFAAHARMEKDGVSTVIHAAAVAFGFVFLHPFEDGNGRVHRFLIHNILARRGFTPKGVMFPVSAAMLKNSGDYDACLEAFSQRLLPLVEYSLDEEGQMTVHNETASWYRYMDMTAQTEALFRFIQHTIETELAEELAFLDNYDKTRTAIQQTVDMPDRLIDLFIRFCLQNNGRLPATRRARHFEALTEEEISRMEQAVQEAYGGRDLVEE